MDCKRTELLPGVWLTSVVSEQLSSTSISINLLSQLQRETAAVNALIPSVLCCGTALFPDSSAVSDRLSQLNITSISPVVRKFGEVHSIGLKLVTNEHFVQLKSAVEFICSMLVSPATKGGLLNQNYVDTMKSQLSEIDEYDENIFAYARHECLSAMCCYEDYSTPLYGESSDMESIHYRKFTKEYRNLLQVCPVEIICCLPCQDKNLINYFKEALAVMPRGEIDFEIGTDIRLNAIEDTVRIVNTVSDSSSIVFSAGYRFGECMDDADFESMGIMCQLLKNELSDIEGLDNITVIPDIHKGLFTVTGKYISCDAKSITDMISAVIDKIAAGSIGDDNFSEAAKAYSSDTAAKGLSADTLEEFFLSQTLCGLDYSPEELSEAVLDISLNRVSKIASSCECDLVYLTDFFELKDISINA